MPRHWVCPHKFSQQTYSIRIKLRSSVHVYKHQTLLLLTYISKPQQHQAVRDLHRQSI